jgi:hypothetical protein
VPYQILTVRDTHPRITNRFDLEYVMLVRQGVKSKVETVQHIANLHRRQRSRDIRETNDVTEEYCDIVMIFTKALKRNKK